ncbi:MAG TPA: threonine--tRNA ligase [Thermoprotei archaeon]|nr:threonine--tRNA ligase [Thermoprotei archaeon]
MRIVLLHSDFIEFEPKIKAIEEAEEVSKEKERVEEALVVFTTVEKGDNEEVVRKAADSIVDVLNRVKAPRVVLYPWAHLSSNLASPDAALTLMIKLEEELKERGIEVVRAPFGWYKAFTISVKGHPLAELSRSIAVEEEKKEAVKRGEKKHLILTPEGEELDPEKADLSKFNEEFRILVEKEALKKELKGGKPVILEYLQRFGFEWEPYSDFGHMRMGPYASLIFDLAAEYSRRVAHSLPIPVFEVKGTAFFNLKVKPVREHAELYGDRLYVIRTDRGDMVLRYAACHQQFSLIKDWTLSYKDLPFGAFEIADSYRYEQSGEAELCFRLRRFYMPDLHIFVKDEEEAKKWVMIIHDKIMSEMSKVGRNYELLVNVSSPEQYEKYKGFIIELAEKIGKPVLVAVYPPGINYYWTINIEYHILDQLKRPREVGTVQIDIGNAKRFGIKYMDKDGTEKYPVILHTAIIGSLERYIYSLFDTALMKKKPVLPLWISPVQVRVIPVSKEYMPYAEQIAEKLSSAGYRVDIDDTDRPLGRKIVDAEREWVPYIIVIGEKEVKENVVNVRVRETGEQKIMKIEELLKILDEETCGYPKKPYGIPRYLSKRPGILKLS